MFFLHEATTMKGKGRLTPHRPAGDVMKESAQAAPATRVPGAKQFGIKEDFFAEHDIHVHIPEGHPRTALGGITTASAMISAFTAARCAAAAADWRGPPAGNVLPSAGLRRSWLRAVPGSRSSSARSQQEGA
jgi:ATP-dependent Lon protease